MKKKNAFTLIELIAVLVILAIIALIITPLVLNIVKKAKDSANKRSVDAYGKALELAVATYLLDTGDYPTTIDDLTVEYSGNEVVCNVKNLNEDGSIYLSECTVKGTEVKDSKTEDSWYHYGKTTTVSYDAYNIGDTVTYNGMEFYVIANSDEKSDSVTLLKAEPLTVEEVNQYGVGHINVFDAIDQATNVKNDNFQKTVDKNGYGAIMYYSSETCGYTSESGYTNYVDIGCTTDYKKSEVKYAVDAWAKDKFEANDLTEDSLGYKARLITYEELLENLGYENNFSCTASCFYNGSMENVPAYVYNNNYSYWTMSSQNDSDKLVWTISVGYLHAGSIGPFNYFAIRPVITLLKSAI